MRMITPTNRLRPGRPAGLEIHNSSAPSRGLKAHNSLAMGGAHGPRPTNKPSRGLTCHGVAQRRQKARHLLRSLLPGHALLAFLFLISTPILASATGEQYLEAYNVLAGMLNERADVVGVGGVSIKQPGASVTQTDLNGIRTRTVALMTSSFTVSRDDFDLTQRNSAFPCGLRWDGSDNLIEPSLMSGIGNNGYFTKVPPDCTESGDGAFANSFTDVPLLWIHFKELHEALSLLLYTTESYYVAWANNNNPDWWAGGSVMDSWDDAKAAADSDFAGNDPIVMGEFPPHAFAIGKLTSAGKFAAQRKRACGYGVVHRLSTNRLHTVHFYNYAIIGSLFGGTYQITEFDDTGAEGQVGEDAWTCWDSSDPTHARTVTTRDMLGTGAYPAWGSYSLNTWVYKGPGWKIDDTVGRNGQCMVIEWSGFSCPALENPAVDDPETDGLAATGCEYTGSGHPATARQVWRNMKADPLVKFPLGISSGLTSGKLRVKAYISEYMLGNQARQMLSLDTAVINESSGSDWGFVTIKRPSGTEVVFALSGDKAGQPINTGNRYRALPVDDGFEIHFPDRASVVHAYGSDGALCQVRRTEDHHEVSIDGSPDNWPGLAISRDSGEIQYVVSPLWVAEPVYSGDLVDSVTYKDHEGSDLSSIGIGAGSRIFTIADETGTPRSQTRISVTNGHAETTYGVYTDGALFIGDKTVRSESYDEDTGEMTVTETRILYPDTISASSNVLERTISSFAWGFKTSAERIAVPNGADQVTTYAYYTNSVDTNNYRRLRMVVQPDGSWERYSYDDMGRRTTVIEPFKNAGNESNADQCRATQYCYGNDLILTGLSFPANDVVTTNDHRPRLIIEETLGVEVSRTYHAYLPDRRVTKRCVAPGAAYNDASNLVTTVFVITNGTFEGYTGRIEHPNGTITAYSYEYDAGNEHVTTTKRTGAGSGSTVTNGTERVTVVDDAGRMQSSVSRDILTGIVISGTEYTRDAFGRTTCISNTVSGTFTVNEYGLPGLTRSVDADGIETTYEYTKSRSKHLAASARLGVTSRSEYDVLGNTLNTWRSATGQPHVSASSAYDAAGRIIAATNEAGHVTSYDYTTNSSGESVSTVTYPDGSTRIETLYRDGRVRAVGGTAAAAMCYDYGMDGEGQYTVEYKGADTSATEWIKTYTDMLGRTQKTVYPDGHTVTHTYDAAGRQTERTDGFTATLTEYDSLASPFRTAVDMNDNSAIDMAGTDRITETTTQYGTFKGMAVREATSKVYATNNSATATIASTAISALAGSSTWTISYGRTNRTSVSRNRAKAARTETLTRSDGTQIVNHYTNGLLKCTVRKDSTGGTIASRLLEYDAWNRLSSVIETAANGETRTTRNSYSAAGLVTNSSVATASTTLTTSFEFDSMGRRTKTVLPDGGEVTYAYSDSGELIQQSGAGTYPVTYSYDALGRLSSMSTYRAGFGGAADTTTWNYDPQRGWLTSRTYADGNALSYEYYGNGTLKKRTSARGLLAEYSYDRGGHITAVDYSDATPGIGYTRDRLGRVVQVTDAIGTWTKNHFPDGRLASSTLPQLSGGSLDYAYDSHGRRTNMAVRVSGSTVNSTAYTFDTAGRIGSVSGGTQTATYRYGCDGSTVTNIDLGGSMTASKAYDGHNRLLSMLNTSPTGTISSATYTYNPAGRRTKQVMADGSYWLYAYDDMGQLTSAKKHFVDGLPFGGSHFRYSFDTIGNRKTADRFRGASTLSSAYTANNLNQYTQRTVPGEVWATGSADPAATVTVREGTNTAHLAQRHGDHFWAAIGIDNTAADFSTTNLQIRARTPQPQGPVTNSLVRTETRAALIPETPETFTYDPDGNLLSDGLRTYGWNAENRLITVSNTDALVTFTYDHQGRRTRKTVTQDAANTEHIYVYDGWNLVMETQHSSTPPLQSTNTYLWGLDISDSLGSAGGIGGLLSILTPDSRLLTPAFDGNGNILNLLDTTDSTIAATYEYDPFGQLLKSEQQTSTPFKFSTKYQDPDTDLIYYGYRHLNPETGRWLSRDPIGENGGINLHAFVQNAPPNAIDALGLALYAFDGTANVPDDETNVYLTYASGWGTPNKHYERGIGNEQEHTLLDAILRQATGLGLSARRSKMLREMEHFLEAGDTDVDVIGFSRGAVTAITFAEAVEKLKKEGVYPYCLIDRIRFMGLYDPVPGPTIRHRPRIPSIVQNTAIAYSLDEKRHQFAQSMYSGSGVTAAGFRGGHSDVGGGYEERGLANISLEWMIDQGRNEGAPFKYPSPTKSPWMVRHQEINYNTYLYVDRSGLGSIPHHPSVSRLVAGPVDQTVRTPRHGVDVTRYLYYIDSIAPRNNEYRAGDRRF